jgi:ubiquinone biosynthesis protein UbiJ
MSTSDDGHRQTDGARQQKWESLADELRKTTDIQKAKELVMLLEKEIFDRQQELALNAGEIGGHKVEKEEQSIKRALDILLEVKVKKLGFPNIR